MTKMLTPREAGEYVGLSGRAIVLLIQRGELKAINKGGNGNGRRYAIKPRDLEQWMAAREVVAA